MKDGFKMAGLVLGVIIAVIAMLAFVIGVSGLIYWGIGAFVVWAFGINFIWTFWHGVAIAILASIFTGSLTVKVKKEN